MKRYVLILIVALAPVVWAQSPAPADQVQQLQQGNQQLAQMLREEQAKTKALASQSAAQDSQIQQLQAAIGQQLIPACVAAVESANPAKTLDTTTLKVKDKPAAPVAAAAPAKESAPTK